MSDRDALVVASVTVEIDAPAGFVWDVLSTTPLPAVEPVHGRGADRRSPSARPSTCTLPNPDGSAGTFVNREYIRSSTRPRDRPATCATTPPRRSPASTACATSTSSRWARTGAATARPTRSPASTPIAFAATAPWVKRGVRRGRARAQGPRRGAVVGTADHCILTRAPPGCAQHPGPMRTTCLRRKITTSGDHDQLPEPEGRDVTGTSGFTLHQCRPLPHLTLPVAIVATEVVTPRVLAALHSLQLRNQRNAQRSHHARRLSDHHSTLATLSNCRTLAPGSIRDAESRLVSLDGSPPRS